MACSLGLSFEHRRKSYSEGEEDEGRQAERQPTIHAETVEDHLDEWCQNRRRVKDGVT